jgi:hypothetical protein
MLWLARVYAGSTPKVACIGIGWDNLVSDWARRLRWQPALNGFDPLAEPHPTLYERIRDPRTSTPIESLVLEYARNRARRLARGAVQGGR